MGLKGNEKMDTLAWNTLSAPPRVHLNIPGIDFRSLTCRFIHNEWQNIWSSPANHHNKLFQIHPTLTAPTGPLPNRHDNVVITRLCLVHTNFSHAHVIGRALGNPSALSLAYCSLSYIFYLIVGLFYIITKFVISITFSNLFLLCRFQVF